MQCIVLLKNSIHQIYQMSVIYTDHEVPLAIGLLKGISLI